jgi:putative N-acetylmannosamine-6-phosphate epimerase
MADCSTLAEAEQAAGLGIGIVGTTMSGYTGGEVPGGPDLAFLAEAARRLQVPVIAEGRFTTPELAARAIELGAHAVVVGSAITRPELVTGWFKDAVDRAGAAA